MSRAQRTGRSILPAIVGCLLIQACGGSSSPKPLAATPKQPQGLLGVGDVFEVRVYGEPELSGTYRVSPDGTIDFPLIGRLHVGEASDGELSVQVTTLLKRYVKDPHVSIYVKEYNSQKVFVFGEVQRPGTFKYEQGMNIVQAITLAGGFARLADKSGTYITRTANGSEERIRVSVAAIGEGREPNLELEPGDIVYVPEALF